MGEGRDPETLLQQVPFLSEGGRRVRVLPKAEQRGGKGGQASAAGSQMEELLGEQAGMSVLGIPVPRPSPSPSPSPCPFIECLKSAYPGKPLKFYTFV